LLKLERLDSVVIYYISSCKALSLDRLQEKSPCRVIWKLLIGVLKPSCAEDEKGSFEAYMRYVFVVAVRLLVQGRSAVAKVDWAARWHPAAVLLPPFFPRSLRCPLGSSTRNVTTSTMHSSQTETHAAAGTSLYQRQATHQTAAAPPRPKNIPSRRTPPLELVLLLLGQRGRQLGLRRQPLPPLVLRLLAAVRVGVEAHALA
jgi:hypothetical protein